MTKEQAIEICNEIIQQNNEIVKQTRLNKDINAMQLTANCDNESLAIETVLSMLKEKDAKIEHLEEKRNNQKAELAILNEKQKEMNKLINTVSSYKGMLRKEQKDHKKKDKIINEMAKYIDSNNYVDNEECQFQWDFKIEKCNAYYCRNCIKQHFEMR